MRIRRTFNVELPDIVGQGQKRWWALSAVPIIYKRDRKIVNEQQLINLTDKRTTVGSLFNIRYIPSKHWWFEATTGIEHERVRSRGTSDFTASRTALDDIVLAGGYNFFPIKKSQITLYGLAGFPTTRNVTLLEAQDTLVGTRFFSAGVGSEFSYGFMQSVRRSFTGIFQNRFLHFFSRRWNPILPVNAKIQPGNVIDFLLGLRYRERKNIFETGYNPTLFTNQAVILPTRTITSDSWGRHSFYVSYWHLFTEVPVQRPPIILGAGMLISRAKRFETKIFSIWGNFTIVF